MTTSDYKESDSIKKVDNIETPSDENQSRKVDMVLEPTSLLTPEDFWSKFGKLGNFTLTLNATDLGFILIIIAIDENQSQKVDMVPESGGIRYKVGKLGNFTLKFNASDMHFILIFISVIVGDGAVGATALLLSHIKGEFVDFGYVPTVYDTFSNDYVKKGVPRTIK